MTKMMFAAPVIAAVLVSGSAFAAMPPASAPTKPAAGATAAKTVSPHMKHRHHRHAEAAKTPA